MGGNLDDKIIIVFGERIGAAINHRGGRFGVNDYNRRAALDEVLARMARSDGARSMVA